MIHATFHQLLLVTYNVPNHAMPFPSSSLSLSAVLGGRNHLHFTDNQNGQVLKIAEQAQSNLSLDSESRALSTTYRNLIEPSVECALHWGSTQ